MSTVPSVAASDEKDVSGGARGLAIEGVAKTFGAPDDPAAVEALRPIDLVVAPGEFVAVIGPSGCGKSTLLNIVAGFENASAGRVSVDGVAVDRPDIDRGMVFQQYALFPWLNVIRNVAFGLKRSGLSASDQQATAMRYLELVGLADFADADPASLSGGMKQRVALARTFCTNPSIILMDEPFGALDALTRGMLQKELLGIWRRDARTVMLITHSVQEAVFLATRVVVMTGRPGQVKLDRRIDLDYPREPRSESFRAIEGEIMDELTDEIAKSYGGATGRPGSIPA